MNLDSNPYYHALKSKIESYAPISPASWTLIKSICHFQESPKGEILLHHGQKAKNLYFIVKGAIRAYFIDNKGNFYNKNLFLETDLACSTVSLLQQKGSDFTLETLEDCLLICINYSQYRQLINKHNDLTNFYIAYLERNWIIEKEQREVSIVMENATERYLKLLEQYPTIDERIAQRHISSHLGITPTQLSRIRKNLK